MVLYWLVLVWYGSTSLDLFHVCVFYLLDGKRDRFSDLSLKFCKLINDWQLNMGSYFMLSRLRLDAPHDGFVNQVACRLALLDGFETCYNFRVSLVNPMPEHLEKSVAFLTNFFHLKSLSHHPIHFAH